MDDPYYEIVDITLKVKLITFITGYVEEYEKLPSITYIQSIFKISKLDVEIALLLYGSRRIRHTKTIWHKFGT